MKNRPSSHLLLLVIMAGLSGLAYLAIHRAGLARGYSTSLLLALRDILLFVPIMAIFLWLVKRRRYAGDLKLLTLAILLFSIGQFMQYRLFTDPEYSASMQKQARAARLAKANTVREQSINQYYDADKKRALFGDPDYRITPRKESVEVADDAYWSFSRVLGSLSTLIPLVALAGFVLAFAATTRDEVLIWLQRHSLLIAMVTTVPFLVVAIIYTSGGKFIGNTTPWELVKISFPISYAGILADQYRHLSRTRWGIPPWRFMLPFLVVALMPIVSFFALSDFGQMLVFLGAYLTLYLVAVRRVPQVAIALILVGMLLIGAILVAGIYKMATDKSTAPAIEMEGGRGELRLTELIDEIVSRGIPRRIHQRFHLWRNGGLPPDPDRQLWWAEQTKSDKRGLSNEDLWYGDYAYQPSQALFGIGDGRLFGKGLGRGYPESVPIADSDFIYAALAEETGLIGGGIVLFACLLLAAAGLQTAIEAQDMFTKLLAAGIASFLGLQAIVNIGGVVRLLPMTGITLPFVSHGGWSLITSFWMLGMLLAISHRNRARKSYNL